MEQYLALYKANPLFAGVEEAELLPLMECLGAKKRSCARGDIILAAGDTADRLGIVLSGRINTVYEDVLGGRSILGDMGPGQLFCDAFSCARGGCMPVSVAAQTDCTVVLISTERILHTCAHACRQHQRLTENLVHILADKYVALNRKLLHLSARTTRRKLLSYLSEQMRLAGGGPFAVPFNQQELADYLFIERSGLSTEWNRLKKEGVLAPHGDGLFTLCAPPCEGNDCGS